MTLSQSTGSRLDRLVRSPKALSRGGKRYSSFVRSLRVVLPLTAGALLLLAVMWPRLDWRAGLNVTGLPRSLDAVESQEIRMVAARLIGTDEQGRPFILRAAEAEQLEGMLNRVLLHRPEAEIEVEDGAKIRLSANEGEYTREDEQIVFRGNVVLIHDLGYRIETEVATVDIPEAKAYGDSPVSGNGPSGAISGSGFEVLDKGKTVKILGRSKLILEETLDSNQ